MITLLNNPAFEAGGLWFVIPDELQHAVRPMLKHKMEALTHMPTRKRVRAVLTLAAQKEDYSPSIACNGGYCFYMSDGMWRVGSRGIHSMNLARVKQEILEEIATFAK